MSRTRMLKGGLFVLLVMGLVGCGSPPPPPQPVAPTPPPTNGGGGGFGGGGIGCNPGPSVAPLSQQPIQVFMQYVRGLGGNFHEYFFSNGTGNGGNAVNTMQLDLRYVNQPIFGQQYYQITGRAQLVMSDLQYLFPQYPPSNPGQQIQVCSSQYAPGIVSNQGQVAITMTGTYRSSDFYNPGGIAVPITVDIGSQYCSTGTYFYDAGSGIVNLQGCAVISVGNPYGGGGGGF